MVIRAIKSDTKNAVMLKFLVANWMMSAREIVVLRAALSAQKTPEDCRNYKRSLVMAEKKRRSVWRRGPYRFQLTLMDARISAVTLITDCDIASLKRLESMRTMGVLRCA